MRPDTVTLTMRQLDRLKILQALADGHLRTGIAAVRLGVSVRQALRLLRRYQAQGAAGLQNRHQGGNRATTNYRPAWSRACVA